MRGGHSSSNKPKEPSKTDIYEFYNPLTNEYSGNIYQVLSSTVNVLDENTNIIYKKPDLFDDIVFYIGCVSIAFFLIIFIIAQLYYKQEKFNGIIIVFLALLGFIFQICFLISIINNGDHLSDESTYYYNQINAVTTTMGAPVTTTMGAPVTTTMGAPVTTTMGAPVTTTNITREAFTTNNTTSGAVQPKIIYKNIIRYRGLVKLYFGLSLPIFILFPIILVIYINLSEKN